MATLVSGILLKARTFEELGLTITRDDLQRLADNFRPVPILYEHLEAGLDFGEVREVSVQGDTLMGVLAFYPEAWQLLQRKGLKGLSVAMPWAKTRLLEVSITSNPREKEARLLASETVSDETRVLIMGELHEQMVSISEGNDASVQAIVELPDATLATPEEPEPAPSGETVMLSVSEYQQLRLTVQRLEQERRLAHAREKARTFREQGYITPAQEGVLAAILATDAAEIVRFRYQERELTLGALLEEFVRLNQRFALGQTLGVGQTTTQTYDLSAFGLSKEGEHLARLFAEGKHAEAQAYIRQLQQGGRA